LISLINDHSLFGLLDHEIIQKLSKRIGKNVSETLFYRLKKEAKAMRQDSEQWLDNYAKYQFVEFYRQRIDELKYVQRNLIKILASETEKEEEKQDKIIINQLSKTIAEISKTLADFGMAPPMMSKILDLISTNYSAKRNQESEEIRRIKIFRQQAKSAITIPTGNEDQYDNREGSLIEEYDSNAVF